MANPLLQGWLQEWKQLNLGPGALLIPTLVELKRGGGHLTSALKNENNFWFTYHWMVYIKYLNTKP